MRSRIGKVVLQLVGLHSDTHRLLGFDLLGPCSLLLLLPLVYLPQAVADATVLEGTELAVLEGDLVDDDCLAIVHWPWSLLVEVAPLARTDDLAVAEAHLP